MRNTTTLLYNTVPLSWPKIPVSWPLIPETPRNRSRWTGMAGHDAPESSVTFVRNHRSRWSGIPITRNRPCRSSVGRRAR